jgi:hypothetical protein
MNMQCFIGIVALPSPVCDSAERLNIKGVTCGCFILVQQASTRLCFVTVPLAVNRFFRVALYALGYAKQVTYQRFIVLKRSPSAVVND